MQLKNQRIVLTGAAGGLGQHIALILAHKGAHLAIVGRNERKLQQLANEIITIGGKAEIIIGDFEVPNAPESIVNEATKKLGGIDILINNAGILDFTHLEDQSAERIAQMIHTNVTAPIQLARAVLPQFKGRNHGHYVMVGSIFGSLGFPHFATYCASKFAVHGFSQALRRELVTTNIGVTYIAPRGINTEMNEANTMAMWKASGNQVDTPEKVASLIVKALEREKQEVFIGQPQTFFAWLNGVLPVAVNLGLKKQTLLAESHLKGLFNKR